ncbi:MAG: rhodanese-like domain-containing protein [Dehalococcoidales bacterium]|nr:rhodanese-like domain-containing protein [Dehalococcoidales bacterium]
MRRLLFLVSVVALLVSACASAPNPTSGREVTVDGKSYQVITVSQLKSALDKKDFLLLNVHVPYAGEIKGTDLFIPYTEIEKNLGKLPADKAAMIVVYCRSGQMSSIAAKTLTRLGYTNIRDVDGGMMEWEKEGYELIQAPLAR